MSVDQMSVGQMSVSQNVVFDQKALQKNYFQQDQGTLTDGEGSVQMTSLYKQHVSAHFYTENMINLVPQQSTLMRRSTVLSFPLQLVFPGKTFLLFETTKFFQLESVAKLELFSLSKLYRRHTLYYLPIQTVYVDAKWC